MNESAPPAREHVPTPPSARRPDAADERGERATLSRELSELLLELSIGAHRYAMYPAGHPSLGPVVENVIGRLGEIFEEGRRQLSIGVARRQLVIEGTATDSKHPVLADLARRLHEHQIAALIVQKGTQTREMEALLTVLARDTGRDGQPVGLLPPDQVPSWEHVRIVPKGYEHLAMVDGEGDGEDTTDPAEELWLELARAALTRNVNPDEAEDARGLARVIGGHDPDGEYDDVIATYMRRLAVELRDRDTGEAAKIRQRLSTLIEELDEDTLLRLVEMGGNREQRHRFLLDANQGLAVDAVMKILRAAAATEGQSISTSLTRMLTKLSAHARHGSQLARQADTALRDNVQRLIRDWELEDPNPDQYTALLDAMAGASPLFERDAGGDRVTGPERVVKMAIEVDAWGTTVEKAVSDMLDQQMSNILLGLVDEAPETSRAADQIRKNLAQPAALRRLLSGRDVDEAGLRSLVARMGDAAVDPLLEVLCESDSRSVRRKVFDALGRLGPIVGERALARLQDPRWYVVRNMLALLGRTPDPPEKFDPVEFTRHNDARVRREAFTLVFREGGLRARTLALALAEKDERLVRMALLELKEGMPETLVPTVVNRVLKGDHPPEVRALAARVLRHVRSSLARDALLSLAGGGKSLFGRVKLADKSPAMLAALESLAVRWRDDEEVSEVLDAAGKSKDPEVRNAVARGSA